LQPEPQGPPPSRRALLLDGLLAVVLTALAVHQVVASPMGWALVGPLPVGAPAIPSVPVAPGAPGSLLRAVHSPWVVAALTTAPLALRRVYPLGSFAVVVAAAIGLRSGGSWITVLACVIGAYSAITHSRYRVQAMAGALLAATAAATSLRKADPLPGWTGPFVVVLLAGFLASVARTLRQQAQERQQRLEQVLAEQEGATRRAVEEERSRIAAELHDVVTHNVSVMVIQAGAARKVLDTMPEQAKEALLAVESGGRAAMAELRHVMGLLAAAADGGTASATRPAPKAATAPTPPDAVPPPTSAAPDSSGSGHDAAALHPSELEPQPGLAQLTALVDRVRATGLPVELDVSLPPSPLLPGVDLAAYRVVQEALTNTMKHAVGGSAQVMVGHQGDWLEITVTDTGGVPGPQAATGNGRGLLGLRERLAVYGGTLDARRRIGGGYRIDARLPWRTPA
ncbi:sensor histidine kinase, partial [Streptacidiphilus monticola]